MKPSVWRVHGTSDEPECKRSRNEGGEATNPIATASADLTRDEALEAVEAEPILTASMLEAELGSSRRANERARVLAEQPSNVSTAAEATEKDADEESSEQ